MQQVERILEEITEKSREYSSDNMFLIEKIGNEYFVFASCYAEEKLYLKKDEALEFCKTLNNL